MEATYRRPPLAERELSPQARAAHYLERLIGGFVAHNFTARALPGCSSGLSVPRRKSVLCAMALLYGAQGA
jgi:hypothetical protein